MFPATYTEKRKYNMVMCSQLSTEDSKDKIVRHSQLSTEERKHYQTDHLKHVSNEGSKVYILIAIFMLEIAKYNGLIG